MHAKEFIIDASVIEEVKTLLREKVLNAEKNDASRLFGPLKSLPHYFIRIPKDSSDIAENEFLLDIDERLVAITPHE